MLSNHSWKQIGPAKIQSSLLLEFFGKEGGLLRDPRPLGPLKAMQVACDMEGTVAYYVPGHISHMFGILLEFWKLCCILILTSLLYCFTLDNLFFCAVTGDPLLCKGESVSESSLSFVIRENKGSFIAFIDGLDDQEEQDDEADEPPRKKAKERR